ncbi:hypothetical protein AAC387_Pa06g0808 [Persea americana]
MSLRKAFRSGRRSRRSGKIISSSSTSDPFQEQQRGEGEKRRERVEEEEELADDCWSGLLPELLEEIIRRVESSEDRWPFRRNVVACACVCKRWREITREIVKSPQHCGKITFPSSLKEPGPRDLPMQCYIKRNKKNSLFFLYLGLNQTSVDKGKFLLAARRFKRGARTKYIISLDADDFSQGSNAYVGKLCSNVLGTQFAIYDSQPPFNGAKPSNSRTSRRFGTKQVFPQATGGGTFEIGQVSYKFNLLKSKGPRRMSCTVQCPSSRESIDQPQKSCEIENHAVHSKRTVLKNRSPRWHEHLQCWCLNFHERVTVASVKNFQLVASVDPSQPSDRGDEDTVLLQFGKVGDDLFTMDYREPLSAFQAFAICLTSFGTKIACE